MSVRDVVVRSFGLVFEKNKVGLTNLESKFSVERIKRRRKLRPGYFLSIYMSLFNKCSLQSTDHSGGGRRDTVVEG